jgi:hypothetical protein
MRLTNHFIVIVVAVVVPAVFIYRSRQFGIRIGPFTLVLPSTLGPIDCDTAGTCDGDHFGDGNQFLMMMPVLRALPPSISIPHQR